MSEVLLPMMEEEWKKPPVLSADTLGPSLMTPLGLIEGDILTILERDGATAMRRLVRELDWPTPMVFMAAGALIREGLVRAVRHDLEVIVDLAVPCPPRPGSERSLTRGGG